MTKIDLVIHLGPSGDIKDIPDSYYEKVRILIVGGTGFIGYHLAKKCLNLGWSVIIFAIHRPKRIRKLNRAKYLVGDLYNRESLKNMQ